MSDKIPAENNLKTPDNSSGKITACSNVLTFELAKDGNGYIVEGVTDKFIKSVTIPEVYHGLPVTEIGDYAFSVCTGLQSIEIPESVTKIGDKAFEGCYDLQSIEIPSSVTKIGVHTFYGCEELRHINYKGTKAQWTKILIGIGWNRNIPAKTVHCTDGDIKI